MSKHHHKPNPDDRSDNVEKLQNMVHDTIENMSEAEDRMEWATNEEKKKIEAKNERREQAIEGFRAEIKDEYNDQKN